MAVEEELVIDYSGEEYQIAPTRLDSRSTQKITFV